MLIFESNSRDKSPSVEKVFQSFAIWNNLNILKSNGKISISQVFMDWYKRQAKERGNYVNKTVSRDLYNILAPEVKWFLKLILNEKYV